MVVHHPMPEQNGGVYVSPDVIGMIIALFAFTLTVLGGVAGMLARQSKAIDARFDRMDARLEGVEGELVEVKVAIARLEGPQRRLQQL
ncbi:hypothetical protein GCM10027408_01280 [Microbacterium tumbae]